MGKKSPVITLTSICRIVAVMFVAISGSLCNGLTEGRAADEIQDGPVLPSRVTEDQKIRHVLNRLTFGPSAGDVDNVKRIGLHNFIERQLHPSAIQEPGALERALAELPSLRMNPVAIFRTYGRRPKDPKLMSEEDRQNLRRKMVRVMQEAVRGRILRSLYSERQLQEVLTDFWFNHFNVFAGKGLDRIWVGSYERDAIRPHVLGKFRTLLGATARHPAMLFYLDNWLSPQ